MENVVLTVHLILALLLIGIVLLQRSEGGGLGLGGGGGGGGGVMTGRQAANALSRLTWILAAGFLVTSITLTVIAARNSSGGSVLDQIGAGSGSSQGSESGAPALPSYAPPPGIGEPIAPPAPEAAAPAATEAAPAESAPAPAVETPAAEAPAAEAPATAPVAPPVAN